MRNVLDINRKTHRVLVEPGIKLTCCCQIYPIEKTIESNVHSMFPFCIESVSFDPQNYANLILVCYQPSLFAEVPDMIGKQQSKEKTQFGEFTQDNTTRTKVVIP